MVNPQHICEICGAAADVSFDGRWACVDHWRDVEKIVRADAPVDLRDEIRRLMQGGNQRSG